MKLEKLRTEKTTTLTQQHKAVGCFLNRQPGNTSHSTNEKSRSRPSTPPFNASTQKSATTLGKKVVEKTQPERFTRD